MISASVAFNSRNILDHLKQRSLQKPPKKKGFGLELWDIKSHQRHQNHHLPMVPRNRRSPATCVGIAKRRGNGFGSTDTWRVHFENQAWNPNDPLFGRKGPCFGGFEPKNRGQKGSRGMYMGINWIQISMGRALIIPPKQLQVKIREYHSYFSTDQDSLHGWTLQTKPRPTVIHLETMYDIYPTMFEDSRVPETAVGKYLLGTVLF